VSHPIEPLAHQTVGDKIERLPLIGARADIGTRILSSQLVMAAIEVGISRREQRASA
jgi:hypothetical protein